MCSTNPMPLWSHSEYRNSSLEEGRGLGPIAGISTSIRIHK